jgi:hypothetical protein
LVFVKKKEVYISLSFTPPLFLLRHLPWLLFSVHLCKGMV